MSDGNKEKLSASSFYRRDRRLSPNPLGEEEEHPATRFQFPETQHQPLSLQDIDIAKGIITDPALQQTTAMSTVEEQLAEFRRIAEQQQQQLQQYQQQQLEAQRHFESQQQESQRRYEQSQATVAQLSAALQTLTTHAAALPTAIPTPQRKKPDLPPFDSQHINRWVRRLEAAYQRAGVTLAKDKFAFLESTFEVAANPSINKFLYGTNTEDEWKNFIAFLKEEFGRTKRQKAALLITDYPRQGLRPTQFLAQMDEDTEGISIDDIKKEQLLKSLPSRIREFLGKEVEDLTAEQVATRADAYFDKQGNLLEKSYNVNSVNPPAPNEVLQASYDDETNEVNQVHRPPNRNNSTRPSRPNSRPSGSHPARSASRPARLTDGLCRSHFKFGDEAYTCVADGCRKRHLLAKKSNPQGNARGERRL